MGTKIYLAYGSNMNMEQMEVRCPKARPIGTTEIKDHRLVFRGVADIEPAKGMTVPVAVWLITPECEAALDTYEGVKSGFYRREFVTLLNGDKREKALVYKMNSGGIMPPSDYYLDAIRQGYQDFGLDEKPLNAAVKHSRKHRRVSWEMHQRQARRDARHAAKVRQPSWLDDTDPSYRSI